MYCFIENPVDEPESRVPHINYYTLMNNVKPKFVNNINEANETIETTNTHAMATFTKNITFTTNGQQTYDFTPIRVGDVIDNIHFSSTANAKLFLIFRYTYPQRVPRNNHTFMIEHNKIQEYLFVADTSYTLSFHIVFDKPPTVAERFKISYNISVLHQRYVTQIKNSIVTTKTNIYGGDMAAFRDV